MQPDGLVQGASLARGIVMYANRNAWDVGQPLREEPLAAHFKVSRSPINRALRYLASLGVAEHIPHRGFFLSKPVDDALRLVADLPGENELYLRLARDALARGCGYELTVAELAASYNAPRFRIQRACERAAVEGWLQKSPGHKWTVSLGIATEEDYARIYRLREVIEPAAILEPDYEINASEFENLAGLQHRLATGELENLNAVDMFEINTELHEAIASWSRNQFFLDALKRANVLRRVIEYNKVLETRRIDIFAQEHLAILNELKSRSFKRAAMLMREHLATAGALKAHSLRSG